MFWPLFRALNVLCFIMAALDTAGYLGLPAWLRAIALATLITSTALFVYAFRVLGRDNSYGASDGLVTGAAFNSFSASGKSVSAYCACGSFSSR